MSGVSQRLAAWLLDCCASPAKVPGCGEKFGHLVTKL
jgi:hypothetical protein